VDDKPDQTAFDAAKRVLRYLNGTASAGLVFQATGSDSEEGAVIGLEAFSDSDWASDLEARKSTTGLIPSRRQRCSLG